MMFAGMSEFHHSIRKNRIDDSFESIRVSRFESWMMNKHPEFLRLESNESEDFESSRGWMTARDDDSKNRSQFSF
jgi:hypothetical protein